MGKMEFRFWGICAGCGKLCADATEITDFVKWARSRNIDPSKPHGPRPVDPDVEKAFEKHPEYVPDHVAKTMFSDDPWESYGV